MKIAILGYSGSGKSTLAKRLGCNTVCLFFTLIQFSSRPTGRCGTGRRHSAKAFELKNLRALDRFLPCIC